MHNCALCLRPCGSFYFVILACHQDGIGNIRTKAEDAGSVCDRCWEEVQIFFVPGKTAAAAK
jgi:hypothetical protein